MKSLKGFTAVLFLLLSLGAAAQTREYIRNAIDQWGECRNVAITCTNGDLAIYGRNGSSRSNCPTQLNERLKQLNNDGNRIVDVCLTENGDWVVIYDQNAASWSGIPSGLEEKIRQFNNDGETITSCTFNDRGEWMIVTTDHISASNSSLQDWLVEGCEDYGALWSVHMTDDGAVAVYSGGYKYLGEVPQKLREALKNSELDAYVAKFAGSAWFFANKNGLYEYSM